MSYKRVISNCKKLGLVFKVIQNSSFKCCEAIFQAKTMIEAQTLNRV